ncbi:MAG: NAD(P)-binding domain-containing protein [Nannocystaceae bacterium]
MSTENNAYRYLVIGAGPGGLQLGHYLQEAGEDYLILEAGSRAGTFFEKHPRHRKLLSINKVYTGSDDFELNLRWDWNSLLSSDPALRFKEYSRRYFPHADDLVRYLQDFASRQRLAIAYDAAVEQIRRPGERFEVRLRDGRVLQAEQVIVATGLSVSYQPTIPGFEHVERYDDVSVDPDDFRDQRVLIIGKGNSAFEVADNLIETARTIHLCSPNPVKMAWQTHYVGHLRAVNNDFLDTYQLKSQNAVLNAIIDQIEVHDPGQAPETTATWDGAKYRVGMTYCRAAGERETLLYDRIIACTGWQFDRSIFASDCMPDATINRSSVGWDEGKYPAMTEGYESVNVPGLFFAGTLTATRDFKRSSSAFIHGFRYNAKALFHMLRRRNDGETWPHHELQPQPDSVAEAVLGRINRSSAMWQQFGYLGDVVGRDEQGRLRMFTDVPIDYAVAGGLGLQGSYYAVTLEYGESEKGDPFAAERVHRDDADQAHHSKFLHPIVRRLGPQGQPLAEHHVIEDLASEWREAVHIEPLRRFFRSDLGNLG